MEIDREIIKDKKGGKIHTNFKPTQKHVEDGENKTEVLTDRPELISECEYKGKPSGSLLSLGKWSPWCPGVLLAVICFRLSPWSN